MKAIFLAMTYALIYNSAVAKDFRFYAEDTKRQKLRSTELKEIVTADQLDRATPHKTSTDWNKILFQDETRIMRVAEIFAEGCFLSSEDYSSAALVFQHEVTPDHFFQTFLWANKAVALGDQSKKRLMTLGVDRVFAKI